MGTPMDERGFIHIYTGNGKGKTTAGAMEVCLAEKLVKFFEEAVRIVLGLVAWLGPSETRIYIDRPISNSGRLAGIVRTEAKALGVDVEALTADNVDERLKASGAVVATADSAILDCCDHWLNLARLAVEQNRSELEPLWLLDLS